MKNIKNVNIKSIKKRSYKGLVYNFHLKSNCSSRDDNFWVELSTGVVSHNCFPKDLGAFIGKCNEMGVDCDILKNIFEYNSRIRKVKDWQEIAGATVGGRKYTDK